MADANVTPSLGRYLRKINDRDFAQMVIEGKTVKELCSVFSVTHQAVSLRAKKLGLSGQIRKPARVRSKAEHQVYAYYGLPNATIRSLVKNGVTRAFSCQRRNAIARDIEWKLTLAQWWGIWTESGKWDQRGRERGLWVMARHGDVGPYAEGNVFICTHSQNLSDAAKWRREKDDAKNMVTTPKLC